MSVERFLTGKPETVRKLNLLVDAIKSLQSLNGDIFIRAANTPAGTTVRLNITAVLERIMKNSGTPFRHGHALGRFTPANLGSGESAIVPHSTLTTIPINFSTSNPDGWLDTDTGIFTVPIDGVYFVSGGFIIDFGNLHDEHAWVAVNGGGNVISTPTVTRPVSAPGDIEFFAVQGMMKLFAEQTVTFQAFHLAGGANTMEVSDGNGGHAGLWLIDKL